MTTFHYFWFLVARFYFLSLLHANRRQKLKISDQFSLFSYELLQVLLIHFQLAHEVLHNGYSAGLRLVFHALDVLEIVDDRVNLVLQHDHSAYHAFFHGISSALRVVIILCREIKTYRYNRRKESLSQTSKFRLHIILGNLCKVSISLRQAAYSKTMALQKYQRQSLALLAPVVAHI